MYQISNEVLELFTKRYRQTAEISVDTLDGDLTLTDADIVLGGMMIDRYSVSGDKIEIGSVIAAEMTLKLNNRDGRFDDIRFEGAEMFVRIGIKKWDAAPSENAGMHYIPMGYFTVDQSPRKLSCITLTALDRMVQFDKKFDGSGISFPATVGGLLTYCCQKCNVPLFTDPSTLLNYAYLVKSCPEDDNLTYRQILRWIGEITATCGYIDHNGMLRMEWYSQYPAVKISKSMRYSSDISEQDVSITGVRLEDGDGKAYVSGTEAYALNIVGNSLISDQYTTLPAVIYSGVKELSYRPYKCTTRPLPHLYPMDAVTCVDGKGVTHESIITHWTFKLNGKTTISAEGVTATNDSYAKADPLTAREAAILKKIAGFVNEWVFTIIQGATAYSVNISPAVVWDRGFAPSFAADTVTEVRLTYKGDTLEGVWL